jgi:hypothetical protein
MKRVRRKGFRRALIEREQCLYEVASFTCRTSAQTPSPRVPAERVIACSWCRAE